MQPPDKIVLEHAGALGDFLLAWPFFLSVARHFQGVTLHHAVPSSRARFLAPLAAPCPPPLRRALDARYGEADWPADLQDTLVVRPGLVTRPPFPPSPRFWFVPGLAPGRDVSPAVCYREALTVRGIPLATDAADAFQAFFGPHAPTGNTALLFPGAGHRDKAWPLKHFQYLAARLRERGIRPVYVVGPVEREWGILPEEGEVAEPPDLGALSRLLCAARFVVGPDSGPLHLAALHGVPGLALFGPTSPRQWGPPGMPVLTAGLPCAPCVVVTSGAFAPSCPRPLPCLAGLTVDRVLAGLEGQGLISSRP